MCWPRPTGVSYPHSQHMTTTILKSSIPSNWINVTRNQFHNGIDFSQVIDSVESMPGVLKSWKFGLCLRKLSQRRHKTCAFPSITSKFNLFVISIRTLKYQKSPLCVNCLCLLSSTVNTKIRQLFRFLINCLESSNFINYFKNITTKIFTFFICLFEPLESQLPKK